MLGRGAAAAADDLHAVLGDETAMIRGQFRGGELVDSVAAFVLRQAGVGLHADGHGRVLAEEADRVVHLRRAGGAVEADDVGLETLKHGQRRADLRAQEHGAGGFEGDLDLEGDVAAAGGVRLWRASLMASWQAAMAILAWSRSWQVSISSTSTPPSISASACSR